MDLKAESLRLRDLATVPPTAKSRADVVKGLASKFEGIQALAAEVFGAWGDPASKATLKEWFLETMHRPLGWAIRSVGVRELARVTVAEDANWVLDLYFGTDDDLVQHELLRLAAALPSSPAKAMVEEKAHNPDPRIRHSALKILVWSSWGNPKDLLRPFAHDSDPVIKKMLRAWRVA